MDISYDEKYLDQKSKAIILQSSLNEPEPINAPSSGRPPSSSILRRCSALLFKSGRLESHTAPLSSWVEYAEGTHRLYIELKLNLLGVLFKSLVQHPPWKTNCCRLDSSISSLVFSVRAVPSSSLKANESSRTNLASSSP